MRQPHQYRQVENWQERTVAQVVPRHVARMWPPQLEIATYGEKVRKLELAKLVKQGFTKESFFWESQGQQTLKEDRQVWTVVLHSLLTYFSLRRQRENNRIFWLSASTSVSQGLFLISPLWSFQTFLWSFQVYLPWTLRDTSQSGVFFQCLTSVLNFPEFPIWPAKWWWWSINGCLIYKMGESVATAKSLADLLSANKSSKHNPCTGGA